MKTNGLTAGKDAMKMLGVSRTSLYFLCIATGIQPTRKIIRGRAHNCYTDEDLAALRHAKEARSNPKEHDDDCQTWKPIHEDGPCDCRLSRRGR